jgi:hypothetical protein
MPTAPPGSSVLDTSAVPIATSLHGIHRDGRKIAVKVINHYEDEVLKATK